MVPFLYYYHKDFDTSNMTLKLVYPVLPFVSLFLFERTRESQRYVFLSVLLIQKQVQKNESNLIQQTTSFGIYLFYLYYPPLSIMNYQKDNNYWQLAIFPLIKYHKKLQKQSKMLRIIWVLNLSLILWKQSAKIKKLFIFPLVYVINTPQHHHTSLFWLFSPKLALIQINRIEDASTQYSRTKVLMAPLFLYQRNMNERIFCILWLVHHKISLFKHTRLSNSHTKQHLFPIYHIDWNKGDDLNISLIYPIIPQLSLLKFYSSKDTYTLYIHPLIYVSNTNFTQSFNISFFWLFHYKTGLLQFYKDLMHMRHFIPFLYIFLHNYATKTRTFSLLWIRPGRSIFNIGVHQSKLSHHLFPLYHYHSQRNSHFHSTRLLWVHPSVSLLKYERNYDSLNHFLFPLYNRETKSNYSSWSFFWIYNSSWTLLRWYVLEDKRAAFLYPLCHYQQTKEGTQVSFGYLFSPNYALLKFKSGTSSEFSAYPLINWKHDAEATRLRILTLYSYISLFNLFISNDEISHSLFGIYSYTHNLITNSKKISLLSGFIKIIKDGTSVAHSAWPIYKYTSDVTTNVERLCIGWIASNVSFFQYFKTSISVLHFLWPFYRYERADEETKSVAVMWLTAKFSLLKFEIGKAIKHYALWPLFSFDQNKVEDSVKLNVVAKMVNYQRVKDVSVFGILWRLIKQKKSATSYSFEFNPFFYYEKEKDRGKVYC